MNQQPAPRQVDSWKIAEQNAAEWMRHWGYQDAKVTPSGPDGGIDVRAGGAFAQVKYEASDVGSPALNRFVGARKHDRGKALLFFTGADYSQPAIKYANEMSVALFKYGLDGSMTPMNRHAERIASAARKARITQKPWPNEGVFVVEKRGIPSRSGVRCSPLSGRRGR